VKDIIDCNVLNVHADSHFRTPKEKYPHSPYVHLLMCTCI